MSTLTQINRLSDNKIKIIIKAKNQNDDVITINPKYKWFKLYIRSGGKTFIVINDPDNDSKNCYIDSNDNLIVTIPSKKLNIGFIEYMIEFRISDTNFSDMYQNVYQIGYKQTNIQVI